MLALSNRLFTTKNVELVFACSFIIIWLCYILLKAPGSTIQFPDSESYIHFYSFRSAGYPLFLIVTGVDAVRFVQPVLAAFSLFVLYWQSRQLFSRYSFMALVLVIAVAANARFFTYHYTVSTESLYVSLLMLVAALYMRYARMPGSKWTLALLSVLCGLCMIVRPSAIFLLPALLIGLVIVWHATTANRFSLLLVCIIPLLSIFCAGKVFSSAWHDGQSSSLFTRHVFAKAAMINVPSLGDNSEYGQTLENRFSSVRQFVWSAPGFYVRNHFLPDYEICIQYTCSAEYGLNIESEDARQAALRRIRSNVPGYLALTWHHFRSLWTVYPTSTPGVAENTNSYITANRPIPYKSLVPWLDERVQPPGRIKFIVQFGILLVAVAAAGMIAIGAYRWGRVKYLNPVFAVTVFVSLCMHGSQLLTAMTGVSVIRYTISLWPLFMILLASVSVMLFTVKRRSDVSIASDSRRETGK